MAISAALPRPGEHPWPINGIAMFTPADAHHGRTDRLLQTRADVLAGAYAAQPERFVKGRPWPRPVPCEVWINRPATEIVVPTPTHQVLCHGQPVIS